MRKKCTKIVRRTAKPPNKGRNKQARQAASNKAQGHYERSQTKKSHLTLPSISNNVETILDCTF